MGIIACFARMDVETSSVADEDIINAWTELNEILFMIIHYVWETSYTGISYILPHTYTSPSSFSRINFDFNVYIKHTFSYYRVL